MITVSGGLPFGDGSYRISVLDSGAAGADVGVALLEDNIAAITALVTARLTATIIADDNYARMPPVSLFFTLNPLVPLSLDSEFLGGRVTASVARGILRLQLSGGLPPVSAALVNFNNVPRFVDGLDITVSTKLDNVGLYTARVVLAAADAAEVDVAFLQRARRFEYATTLTVVTPPPIVADWSDQLFVLARAAEGQYAGLLSISGGSVLAAGYSISVFVDSESQLSAHYVRITSSAGFDGFERGSVVFDADAAGSYFGNITASIVINDIRGDTTPLTLSHIALVQQDAFALLTITAPLTITAGHNSGDLLTIRAGGGLPPYDYDYAGTPPPYLTLAQRGADAAVRLAFPAAATTDVFRITLRARDSSLPVRERTALYLLRVVAPPPFSATLTLASSVQISGIVSTLAVFSLTGGNAPYTVDVFAAPGFARPPRFDGTTLLLSDAPRFGKHTITMAARDSNNLTPDVRHTLSWRVIPQQIQVAQISAAVRLTGGGQTSPIAVVRAENGQPPYRLVGAGGEVAATGDGAITLIRRHNGADYAVLGGEQFAVIGADITGNIITAAATAVQIIVTNNYYVVAPDKVSVSFERLLQARENEIITIGRIRAEGGSGRYVYGASVIGGIGGVYLTGGISVVASADIPGRMTAQLFAANIESTIATRSFATVIVSVFGIPRLGVLQHPQRFATAKVAAALSVAALRLLAVSENNRYSLPDSPPGFSVALSSGVLYVLPSALAQTSARILPMVIISFFSAPATNAQTKPILYPAQQHNSY